MLTCEYIKTRRLHLGLTQKKVGLKLGVTTNMIHQIEAGVTIPARLIKPLAKTLKMSIEDILRSMANDYYLTMIDKVKAS